LVTNLKFQEPVQKKSYAEIMNGDAEEEKVNVALGTSKKNFEERLNEGFKGNIPRYQRKNEEMMKMEWANKVAASDRAEAKLYPVLNIPTEPTVARVGQARRNSTSNSTMSLNNASVGIRRNSIFN